MSPPPPAPATLYRWLDRAVTHALVQRDGTGKRNDPYRYWLQGQEAKWAAEHDPDAQFQKAQDDALRWLDGLRGPPSGRKG